MLTERASRVLNIKEKKFNELLEEQGWFALEYDNGWYDDTTHSELLYCEQLFKKRYGVEAPNIVSIYKKMDEKQEG